MKLMTVLINFLMTADFSTFFQEIGWFKEMKEMFHEFFLG